MGECLFEVEGVVQSFVSRGSSIEITVVGMSALDRDWCTYG
jgi:hypothetical protein